MNPKFKTFNRPVYLAIVVFIPTQLLVWSVFGYYSWEGCKRYPIFGRPLEQDVFLREHDLACLIHAQIVRGTANHNFTAERSSNIQFIECNPGEWMEKGSKAFKGREEEKGHKGISWCTEKGKEFNEKYSKEQSEESNSPVAKCITDLEQNNPCNFIYRVCRPWTENLSLTLAYSTIIELIITIIAIVILKKYGCIKTLGGEESSAFDIVDESNEKSLQKQIDELRRTLDAAKNV